MIATGLVLLVAVLHLGFLAMEAIFWQSPPVRRIFGTTAEFAAATRVLAANQGLYNGFLAAGLIFGLMRGADRGAILGFFLTCVVVAGLFGAATASRRILFVQVLPAALALAALAAGV